MEGLYQYDWKQAFSLGERRLANLDPGYVARERLVLATGKNFTHRIYLDQGIYGDLTLIFGRGNWQPLPWSFPDYAQGELPALLDLVRQKYLWQLKAMAAMIKSMTAYGRGEVETPAQKWVVELKSVNHRFLELSLNLPQRLWALEDRFRKLIKSRMARGRVDMQLILGEPRREVRDLAAG